MPDLPISDDELLSCALDGELSASDQAALTERLAGEPALAERYALVSQAEALVATPVTPLSGADRDRLITAALATSTTAGNVTDLAAAGARRSAWRRRGITIAAAAAALVLAVPAVIAINNASDGDYDSASSSLTELSDETTADEASAGDSADSPSSEEMTFDTAAAAAEMPADEAPAEFDTAADDMPTAEAMPASEGGADGFALDLDQKGLLRLSDFQSLSGLVQTYSTQNELQDEVAGRWSGYLPGAIENDPDDVSNEEQGRRLVEFALNAASLGGCPEVLLALDGLDYGGTVMSVSFAEAIVQGEAVTVAVVQIEDGTASLVLIDQNSCAVTFEGPLT
jgi:hypothetical protein